MEGRPHETKADWIRAADVIRKLHGLTQSWPKRSGWRSSTDLLHATSETKVDLGKIPTEGDPQRLAAWEAVVCWHDEYAEKRLAEDARAD